MTPSQKKLFWLLTIAIALTRLLAISHALFDWDEALFTLGVREYDVTSHWPHPPGYPLFVAAAKAIHFLGVPEFRSLQVLVLAASMLLFPALFALARELGFDFATSASGAALFAFLPNVWIHGGTGFSDVPATAAVFIACTLLLRGRRDRRAYLLGAIVLGIAAGIRPMSLLAGAVPALMATWARIRQRDFRAAIAAMVLGGVIALGSYAGAALASHSVADYIDAVKVQSKWVREVDSFRNPNRPSLVQVAKTFFVWPIAMRQQMVGLAALAAISLAAAIVRRHRPPLLAIAVFAPVAVMTWLNLDVEASSRYAIAYMAVHALLAADALRILAAGRARVQAALCAMVIAVFAVWAWPAVQLQRTSDPPPAAAFEWLRRNVAPHELIYVNANIQPLADALLPKHHKVWFEYPGDIEMSAHHAWVVQYEAVPGARNFVWPRTSPMWKIVRRRNFEASVGRVATIVVYGKGWYVAKHGRRRMEKESVTSLPAMPSNGVLRLRIDVPRPQAIEIRMNGDVLERWNAAPGTIERSWTAPSRRGVPNELRIIAADLTVDELTWMPQH